MQGPSSDFTCRGRTMYNLTVEQARLAHGGRVANRLRAKSPVYYWQTTAQRRSLHEAVCQKSSGWHIITFGSHGKFEAKAKDKCRRVSQLRKRVVDSCTALTLGDLPADWARQHGVVLGTLGIGHWRWKAYTILQRLSQLRDGEVLMHADYDLLMAPSPTDDLSALFCLGANEPRGVAAFHFPCFTDRAWTKAEAAAALNATDAQLDSAQQLAVKVPSTSCEDSAHAPAWCLPSPERRLGGLEARRGRMRPPQPAPQLTTSPRCTPTGPAVRGPARVTQGSWCTVLSALS